MANEGGRNGAGRAWVAAEAEPPELVAAEPAARPWLRLVAAFVAGVAFGALGMQWLDDRPRAQPTSVDVRVSLAAQAGTMSAGVGDPVVAVPLVVVNAGHQPVTLTAIRISGPGASLVGDPQGRPTQPLPAALIPGRPVYVRIGIRSDCSVTVRPVPHVTLVVDVDHHVHDVNVTVADLDSIWGQTLLPGVCAPTAG